MIIKYDQLNRMEKPRLTLCNPGSNYNNGLLSKIVGILIDTEAEEIIFNFNATSELNFRVNRIPREDAEENAYVNAMYKAVQNRRLIFVDDIGYFMIVNVEDGFDGYKHYKDVTAKSIDIEIARKMVPFINDGTYRFSTDDGGGNKGILETIVETIPMWTIGHVDAAVAERWRTFEDVNTSLNCLSFMLQSMQDAFECIIVFDIIRRVISVYDQANYVRQTSIHVTKDDLISSIDIIENADDLYTALSVLGDDNITISAINPLGTNVIYDFTYYLSWMSDGLAEKVIAWQNDVLAEHDAYYNENLQYYSLMTEISNLQMEIDKLNTQITMYRRCRDNIVAEHSTELVASYNEVIAENGGKQISISGSIEATISEIDKLISACESNIASTNTQIVEMQTELESIRKYIDAIHRRLAISSCFSEDEYEELSHYIFEGSYSDDYVVITDIMSYDEKFAQMKTLYDRAMSQLKRTAQPTQEFSVDVDSFIFIKDFEEWSEQLETGCLVNVELDLNDIAALFLSTMVINYDDHTMKMTFGNRFNKFDPKSLYEDVLGQISKSSNTISYIKKSVYPIKNGEFDEMKEALQTSRNLTMGAALASEDQVVVIDGSGYTGRKMLEDGTFDPRQVKIINNSIVFTSDAWDACETALGELILSDGTIAYGLNAKTIIGNMIIGGQLNIYDKNGKDLLTVIDDKIELNVSGAVTEIDGRLDEMSSQISQNAEQISATVTKVETMEIGARNLIRNSTTLVFNKYYFRTGTDDTSAVLGKAILGRMILGRG